MTRFRFLRSALIAGGLCGLAVCAANVQAQQYDPGSDASQSYDTTSQADDASQAPGRVARLAYLSGQAQFAPAGENDWGTIEVNRPMVVGDRLLTGDDGRAVLELGDASVRIDNDSAFDFLNLDQGNVQIELSQGTLNLAVRQLDQGENFEVDTPTVAFVASTPGIYRIDNNPSGTGSMVTVFEGAGVVYGENGASRNVSAGRSYRIGDSSLANVDVTGLPQADDFDRFCEGRDASYRRYAGQGQRYVPQDMIGGDDLDEYGSWNQVPEYGNVWYPTSVPTGWAPYRYGHWAWIDPWGWTWVDDQRWGFAPFHYGRWVYVGSRWGWMPGPVNVRPVYAPALVAFVGGAGFSVSVRLGGGSPVGWFPLGPRDVYVPWFHASRNYFNNVNVTNIRNVYVNKTVINNIYNDYSTNRVTNINRYNRYAYRNQTNAVTVVPRNVFTGARPVHDAVLRVNGTQLARSEIAVRPAVLPAQASLGLRRPVAQPTALRGREPFARPVIARHAPAPRPVSFAAREQVIASQHGQPVSPSQMQNLRRERPAANDRATQVKLVPATGAARPAYGARPNPLPAGGQRAATPNPVDHGFHNQIHPIPARTEQAPKQSGELPSARFRSPGQPATLPRAPVIRPADETARPAPGQRPPVASPDRASSPVNSRGGNASWQAGQDARAQQVQQQRQLQMQQQQQQRAQQEAQQREARTQADQQAREAQAQRQQQAQQQRQAQMQQQRDAQMQQQRQQQAQQQREAQMQQREMQQQQAQQQRQAQMEQQREAQQQMQQQRQAQMQQQRQAQMQQREVQQRPQPRERSESDQHDSGHHRPPPSSDDQHH